MSADCSPDTLAIIGARAPACELTAAHRADGVVFFLRLSPVCSDAYLIPRFLTSQQWGPLPSGLRHFADSGSDRS
ncbi:hypothetical protein PSP6_270192 [Paraburkholderia tropica]|nr:hypothetical protein PSP6_270192 [Paraburkholderia tropica]